MKRIIAFMVACALSVSSTVFSLKMDDIQASAATYDDINQSTVFLKQEEWDSCTLSAAAMLVRRVAIMRGDTDWQTINEAELKNAEGMDWDNKGLSWDFTCRGIRIIHEGEKYSLPSNYDDKVKLLKDLLEKSPEGIIAYDRDYPHAILLTDCAGSTFYCADPANSTPDGRIPISESIISIDGLDDYWYCTSPLVSLDNGNGSTWNGMTPVDLGTDFYALLMNTYHWKALTVDANDNIAMYSEAALNPETGIDPAKQLWRFTRQSDGSYVIYNGNKVLDSTGSSEEGSNVYAYADGYVESNAQQWWIYGKDGAYILRTKCTDCVLDIDNNSADDGTNVQMWTYNGTDAQFYSIYKIVNELTVAPGKSGENTEFGWYCNAAVSCFNLKIWQGTELWNGDAYHLEWDTSTPCQVVLPAGTYTAYVDACWGDTPVMSDAVTFTVENSAYVPASTFVYNNHVYALYDGLLLYEDAKALAEQFGGHLATITSEEENTIITEHLQRTEGYEYWIGLERDADTFRWITGETFAYDNFAAGEPNSSGTENAVCIYGGTSYVENGHTIGTWNDEKDEEMRYGFILEIDDIDTLQPAVTAEYNGHKYYRFDEHFNWTEANAIATALGGNLVIINDVDENNFLEDALFRTEPNNWLYWIGLFAPNGEYQWVDGTAPDYLNWNAAEPDCHNGVEFYAEIYTGGIGYAGKWNDNANSSNEGEGFIVEIETVQKLLGDVNCDGFVSIDDAIILNRFLAEDGSIAITENGIANADVTENGSVGTADSTALLRILAGLS